MFTGLIEETGKVASVIPVGQGRRFTIRASKVMDGLSIDDSVAVNGCCLTVIARTSDSFDVEAVEQTLSKTTLGEFEIGTVVNLERAMQLNDRLGGHLVLGHVDGVGSIVTIEERSLSHWVTIAIPAELEKYVIAVGSITLDGISLTVANLKENCISVAIIPHTWKVTNFAKRSPGDRINVEVDMIGKYVEKLMTRKPEEQKITAEWLLDQGK
ncbi:MAG TPA: riboflavin synthase [bacterium]|nr:riboflavin synthase [bacterium]HMW36857.1 riboflavin synthase [bacterium]HMY36356.1 riboflavin synthase [bacterium]HNB10045.1 riboflavin synthase [bacterium]HNC48280.1 riboflavin synthase [bacterium]